MDTLIKFIADGLVIIIVLIGGITFFISVNTDKYQRYTRALMAGLTALTLAKVMSLFYQSGARPFIEMGVDPKAAYLNNPGFPSDHTLFVFTITFIVWATTKRVSVTILLLGLSCLVAFGRVAALVHTPTDVIGGIIAAFLGVAFWYRNELFKR